MPKFKPVPFRKSAAAASAAASAALSKPIVSSKEETKQQPHHQGNLLVRAPKRLKVLSSPLSPSASSRFFVIHKPWNCPYFSQSQVSHAHSHKTSLLTTRFVTDDARTADVEDSLMNRVIDNATHNDIRSGQKLLSSSADGDEKLLHVMGSNPNVAEAFGKGRGGVGGGESSTSPAAATGNTVIDLLRKREWFLIPPAKSQGGSGLTQQQQSSKDGAYSGRNRFLVHVSGSDAYLENRMEQGVSIVTSELRDCAFFSTCVSLGAVKSTFHLLCHVPRCVANRELHASSSAATSSSQSLSSSSSQQQGSEFKNARLKSFVDKKTRLSEERQARAAPVSTSDEGCIRRSPFVRPRTFFAGGSKLVTAGRAAGYLRFSSSEAREEGDVNNNGGQTREAQFARLSSMFFPPKCACSSSSGATASCCACGWQPDELSKKSGSAPGKQHPLCFPNEALLCVTTRAAATRSRKDKNALTAAASSSSTPTPISFDFKLLSVNAHDAVALYEVTTSTCHSAQHLCAFFAGAGLPVVNDPLYNVAFAERLADRMKRQQQHTQRHHPDEKKTEGGAAAAAAGSFAVVERLRQSIQQASTVSQLPKRVATLHNLYAKLWGVEQQRINLQPPAIVRSGVVFPAFGSLRNGTMLRQLAVSGATRRIEQEIAAETEATLSPTASSMSSLFGGGGGAQQRTRRRDLSSFFETCNVSLGVPSEFEQLADAETTELRQQQLQHFIDGVLWCSPPKAAISSSSSAIQTESEQVDEQEEQENAQCWICGSSAHCTRECTVLSDDPSPVSAFAALSSSSSVFSGLKLQDGQRVDDETGSQKLTLSVDGTEKQFRVVDQHVADASRRTVEYEERKRQSLLFNSNMFPTADDLRENMQRKVSMSSAMERPTRAVPSHLSRHHSSSNPVEQALQHKKYGGGKQLRNYDTAQEDQMQQGGGDQKRRALRCVYCGGEHHVAQCPKIQYSGNKRLQDASSSDGEYQQFSSQLGDYSGARLPDAIKNELSVFSRNKQQQQPQFFCIKCGEKGHLVYNCPQTERNKRVYEANRQCPICLATNVSHRLEECPVALAPPQGHTPLGIHKSFLEKFNRSDGGRTVRARGGAGAGAAGKRQWKAESSKGIHYGRNRGGESAGGNKGSPARKPLFFEVMED